MVFEKKSEWKTPTWILETAAKTKETPKADWLPKNWDANCY